jgi:hypothetical protein
MRLVSDPGWILTKNSIVGKAVGLMAGLAEAYREVWAAAFAGDVAGGAGMRLAMPTGPGTVHGLTGIEPGDARGLVSIKPGAARGMVRIEPGDPKVSRGENYRGLPWVMLDYPRVFGRVDVLAIRTMFWWGHGFTVTLHLKGMYQALCVPVIRERRAALDAAGFHVGVHADEWRHEHTEEVYRPFSAIGGEPGAAGGTVEGALGGELGFLKLSAAVELGRWAEAPELLVGLFGTLVGVLRDVF